MLSFLKKFILFFLFVINLFADSDDVYRVETATSSNGEYVHALWNKYDTSYSVIQTASSSNSGATWTNPTSTPANGGAPNLSEKNGYSPRIATNSTGQYVYAIWREHDGTNFVVQTAKSSDYGVTWVFPTSTTGNGGSPDLSDKNEETMYPSIITDSTGQYVYAIWSISSTRFLMVQTVKSSDYGVTWQDPSSTTGDAGPPNLSNSEGNATDSKIATSSTGQYVFATWARYNGSNYIIQTVMSWNYGEDWMSPSLTPGNGGVPNLSDNGFDARVPGIKIDPSGQYIYAIWQRKNNSDNDVIQVAFSSTYGDTWFDPTTTTGDGGTPNLSNDGDNAYYPHISMASNGRDVYATWYIWDLILEKTIVQATQSTDFGSNWINPTVSAQSIPENVDLPPGPVIDTDLTKKYSYGVWFNTSAQDFVVQTADKVVLEASDYFTVNYRSYTPRNILENQFVNRIYWNSVVGAVSYRVYIDNMDNLVYDGADLNYSHSNQFLKEEKTYFITWVDSSFVESDPSQITIQ